jgi:hypothetical protein
MPSVERAAHEVAHRVDVSGSWCGMRSGDAIGHGGCDWLGEREELGRVASHVGWNGSAG